MFGTGDFGSGSRMAWLLSVGCLLQMTTTSGSSLFGGSSIFGDPGWLSPATGAQGAISSAIHARYQPHANDDGAGSHEHHIAIQNNGPKGRQQQEALPGVPGAPCQQPDKGIERQQKRMAVGECACDLRRGG